MFGQVDLKINSNSLPNLFLNKHSLFHNLNDNDSSYLLKIDIDNLAEKQMKSNGTLSLFDFNTNKYQLKQPRAMRQIVSSHNLQVP